VHQRKLSWVVQFQAGNPFTAGKHCGLCQPYTSDKHRFEDPAGLRRLDPGRPSFGREFSDSIAWKIG